MRATLVVPFAVVSTLALFYFRESEAIKCYVCQDCSESFSSEHLQNCSKREDKCIKMQLMSGEIDRMCAEKNRCNGRGNGKSKRSIEEEIEDSLPKRRIVRQLLGGDGGGGSSSTTNKNKGKNKDKQKEEKPGTKDAMEIHCCAEDGCNGATRLSSTSSPYSPLILGMLLLITSTISSRLASHPSSFASSH